MAPDNEVNAVLDSIKPPAGVVLPPREIRAILEKTAGYVARNGLVFEDRIRQKERTNPKFSFLSENDAYHDYYSWRLSEIKEGRGNVVAAGRVGEPEVKKPEGPPRPPEFEFSARMPNISAKDLEIVRLTALFTAKHGRQFMTILAQREAGNYQFDFLRPNHSLHNFFQKLIDQYKSLLQASGFDGEGGRVQDQRMAEVESNISNKYRILEKAQARAAWVKYQNEQKQQKEAEVEKERVQFASIDWHDFVIVETVVFTDADEHAHLAPPTSLSDLQFASLDQKAQMSINSNLRLEEAMPTYPTTYPAYPAYPAYAEPAPIQPVEERPAPRAEPVAPQPMRIKENYVPRAAARAATKQGLQMALCPNCKQQIPYQELEEHMRIELLDPRWKEQKAKAESRYATTNLSTADVANNLKRLASQRSDLFDSVTGEAISEEEAARRKKAAMNYDGSVESKDAARLQMQTANVGEQIRHIHERFGRGN